MQVKHDTIKPTLEDACVPLGKLQFISDTIIAVHAMKDSDGFFDFDSEGLYSMGVILRDCVKELRHLIFEVGMGIDPGYRAERLTLTLEKKRGE